MPRYVYFKLDGVPELRSPPLVPLLEAGPLLTEDSPFFPDRSGFVMKFPRYVQNAACLRRLSWLLPLGLAACRTLGPQPEPESPATVINQPTFALIDTDADGKVSPREMAAYKHQEGLAEVDLDNDKRISAAEWKAARPSAPASDPAFARLDLNRDGFLSEDEAITELVAQTAYQNAFKAMDRNRDGHLHWEEYAAGDGASLDLTLFGPAPDRVGSGEGE